MDLQAIRNFACTRCGECCRGDQVVRLNGDDLELLCLFLGLDVPGDLYRRGVVRDVLEDGLYLRPRLVFRKKPFPFCPFLENDMDDDGCLKGRCMLHPGFKPLVCHLAPLARTVETGPEGSRETWDFVLPVPDCPGEGRGRFDTSECIDSLRERLDREALWMETRRVERGDSVPVEGSPVEAAGASCTGSGKKGCGRIPELHP